MKSRNTRETHEAASTGLRAGTWERLDNSNPKRQLGSTVALLEMALAHRGDLVFFVHNPSSRHFNTTMQAWFGFTLVSKLHEVLQFGTDVTLVSSGDAVSNGETAPLAELIAKSVNYRGKLIHRSLTPFASQSARERGVPHVVCFIESPSGPHFRPVVGLEIEGQGCRRENGEYTSSLFGMWQGDTEEGCVDFYQSLYSLASACVDEVKELAASKACNPMQWLEGVDLQVYQMSGRSVDVVAPDAACDARRSSK